MTTVEIQNPSAWHNLRIASQDRVRNTFEKTATPAPAAVKRATRAELEKIGRELRDVPTRVSTKFGAEMRDVPTPFYKTAGYETLNEFITDQGEKQLRESQKANPAAPSVQHVVDDWAAPKPFASIAPNAKFILQLDESKRFLIESDEETALQLSNVSSVRTIRLRNRNSKTGETTHVAFIAPAREYPQAALVIANGKSSAVVELMPS